MAIKLKVTETNRKLQDLVRQDTLVFPDRKETVMVIEKEKGRLYTQRIRGNAEERVRYQLEKVGDDYVFNNKSEGFVYYFKRIGK
jgi:hypothetical protein